MRILVYCAAYVPANRGGTVRAVEGLVRRLGRELDLYVLTRDRYETETVAFEGICTSQWYRQGEASVYYATPSELNSRSIRRIVTAARPDAYYVNSLFSPLFGALPIALRWTGAIPRLPTVLAPRGELHPVARRHGRLKKNVFLRTAHAIGAYGDVLWQAGSTEEAHQILAEFPNAKIAVARDLSALEPDPRGGNVRKEPGKLSAVWFSRITPMKNLIGAINALRGVRGQVDFDVFGPVTDEAYMRTCGHAVSTLPSNIRVRFKGEVGRESVVETLRRYHVFLLPTFGESFGHAILEAMVAGCLLVISDTTPWRGLAEDKCGWELSVHEELAFRQALQACVDMDQAEFSARSAASRLRGDRESNSAAAITENRALFARLMGL